MRLSVLNGFKHDSDSIRLIGFLYIKNTNEDEFYQVERCLRYEIIDMICHQANLIFNECLNS